MANLGEDGSDGAEPGAKAHSSIFAARRFRDCGFSAGFRILGAMNQRRS